MIVISGLGFGGAERQVVELVNNSDPGKIDLRVCSLSAAVPLAAQLRDASRLHIIAKRGRYDLTVVARLAWYLRKQRIDIVHGWLFDAEIAAALAGRLARVRAVVGSERNTEYVFSSVQRLAYRLTRSCFDRIVANSEAGAAFNRRALGFAADKYRVVRNGVDTGRFRPMDQRAARAALGLQESQPIIGMFASFKQQKNHPLLLRAAQQVLLQYPGAQFMFVGGSIAGDWQGSGAYAQEVCSLADTLGIASACRFMGTREDLPELYAACDLTVLPSLHEGTPNTVLESMACARPVVITDVADNARVAPHGQVGCIVPAGDQQALAAAIVALLNEPLRRAQLGQRARVWAEQEFSLPALSSNMLAVYRELLV